MRNIVLAVMILVAVGIIGSFFFSNNVFSIGSEQNIDETRRVDGTAISKVEASLDIGDIIVGKSPDDQIYVELQGDVGKNRIRDMNFEVEEDGEILAVTVNQKEDNGLSVFSWFDFDFNNGGGLKLTLHLPDKEYESISVASDIGETAVNDVRTQQLATDSDIGETVLHDTQSRKAVLKSNIGEVKVNNGTGAFEIETDTGEVSLDMKAITENITVQSNVGEVAVTVAEQPDQLVMDLQSNVGHVTVENFEGITNTSGNDVYTEIGQDGPVLKVSTDVGEISVERK